MTTTNTIKARALAGTTIAAICFAVVACGSEQGTLPVRESQDTSQHAVADDVAAQIEYRKAALSQQMGRPQHAVADDVERLVEQRKSTLGEH